MRSKDAKTIFFFIKKYKKYITWITTFSILYAIFEGLSIAALFPIINSVVNMNSVVASGGGVIKLLNIFIRIIPVKDVFIAACIFVILTVILKNIFRYLYLGLTSYGSYRVWEDLQEELFIKYINADYRYMLDHKQGEIVYKLNGPPSETGSALQLIPQSLTEILKVTLILGVLFSMSFLVTCGVIVIGGIFYFATRSASRKTSYFLGKGRVEACEEQSVLINEMISGIKQIKVFLSEKRWISKFYNATGRYFSMAKKDALLSNMPASALEIFALVTLSIVLICIRKFSP
ncbi:MAG: ABC transporter transmembrane domain-containing protein, partial [Candidatus Omnitrophica bacterium]|nr:ABC transporter transmembrane domain-containing protein [Candidatus Omnitrophota bacterium]